MLRNFVSSKSFSVLSHEKDLKIRREAGISWVIFKSHLLEMCIIQYCKYKEGERLHHTLRGHYQNSEFLWYVFSFLFCPLFFFFPISSNPSQLMQHWKMSHSGLDASFYVLTKAATSTMLAFLQRHHLSRQHWLSENQMQFFFFFFLQSVFKAFNKHITDFQKLVASLGQIHCMVCHIHLPSIYVRKWQVKLAHTTINPCVHSFLLIPHCTVTIRYAIKTQIPSTQLCGDLLHKQLLEGIKHSTNVVTLLPPVWRQKPYHSSAMLYSHITSLLHVLVLL